MSERGASLWGEGGRFELQIQLGAGASGVVWRARDARLGITVALKTLREHRTDELAALKREFRLLRHLRHPNLVQLYELTEHEGVLALSMELIDGVALDLLDADAWSPREVAVQLFRGLHALHRLGVIHGDVKPSNILVERSGRLVLLDFGFARKVSEPAGEGFTGTLHYAAPELLWRRQSSEASDLFAAAAALIDCFAAPSVEVPWSSRSLQLGRYLARASLACFDDELAEVLVELLRADPSARPSAKVVLERLGELVELSEGLAFVGRHATLERLDARVRAAHGRYEELHLTGTAGIGKTRFVEELARIWRARGLRVLRSHCDPAEALRFQALDGIVDQMVNLAGFDLAREELSADQRAALARGFTITGKGEERPVVAASGSGLLVTALRALLRTFATREQLVLWIDDAQWGDRDSATLLKAVLEDASVPLTLVLSYRSGAERPEFVVECSRSGVRIEEQLAPLATEDCLTLVERAQPELAPAAARALVARIDGNPFLLTRALEERPDVDERALDRTLLRLIASCRSPVPLDVLLGARADERAARELFAMCHDGTLRAHRQAGRPAVTFSHDLLREEFVKDFDDASMRVATRQLAATWAASAEPDPGPIAVLFAQIEETDEAGHWALRAATDAYHALAFARAAEMYALVARVVPASLEEHAERWGESLALAGRPSAAAEVYLECRERVQAPELQRRLLAAAANVLISSGDIERGTSLIDRSLTELAMVRPRTKACIISSFIIERARLRGLPGGRVPVPPAEGCDTLLSLASIYGVLDTVTGAVFQTRMLRLARQLGPSPQLLRAIATERSYEGISRGRGRRWLALERQLRELEAIVADDKARAYVLMVRGYEAFMTGHFVESRGWLRKALGAYSEIGGARWDRNVTRAHELLVEIFLDDLPRVRRELPELAQVFRSQEDSLNLTLLELGGGYLIELSADRPDDARARVERAMEPWETFRVPAFEYLYFRARTNIDLYLGRADDLERHYRRLKPLLWALSAKNLSVEIAWYRALTVPGANLRAIARQIERKQTPLSEGMAHALRTFDSVLRGREAEAELEARRAYAGFDNMDLIAYRQTWTELMRAQGWSTECEESGRLIANPIAWCRMQTPISIAANSK